jgi:hypothetical protein
MPFIEDIMELLFFLAGTEDPRPMGFGVLLEEWRAPVVVDGPRQQCVLLKAQGVLSPKTQKLFEYLVYITYSKGDLRNMPFGEWVNSKMGAGFYNINDAKAAIEQYNFGPDILKGEFAPAMQLIRVQFTIAPKRVGSMYE